MNGLPKKAKDGPSQIESDESIKFVIELQEVDHLVPKKSIKTKITIFELKSLPQAWEFHLHQSKEKDHRHEALPIWTWHFGLRTFSST